MNTLLHPDQGKDHLNTQAQVVIQMLLTEYSTEYSTDLALHSYNIDGHLKFFIKINAAEPEIFFFLFYITRLNNKAPTSPTM